jgi:hypothetical protein
MTRDLPVPVQRILVDLHKIGTEIGHLREPAFHAVNQIENLFGVHCFVSGLREERKEQAKKESHSLRLAKKPNGNSKSDNGNWKSTLQSPTPNLNLQ